MPVTAEQRKEMEEFTTGLAKKRQQVSDGPLLDQCEKYLKQLLDLPKPAGHQAHAHQAQQQHAQTAQRALAPAGGAATTGTTPPRTGR